MSQEQVEILKMVADKVISVEEGERLLRALEEGRRHGHGGWHHHGRHAHGWFARVGDVFGDVGTMVQDAVEEAIGEGGCEFDPEDERFAEVDAADGRVAVPAGTALLVRHRPMVGLGARRGDVELRGVPGETCTVSGPEKKAGLRLFRADGRLAVAFARGPARIEVPATVASLKVATAGGDITAAALGCPAELKTMGGNLALERVTHEVKAKTMGGNVRMTLAPGLTGESRLVTMGGDMELLVPDGVKVLVRAATFGEIRVDPALGAVRRGTDFVIGKAILDIGGAGEAPVVRLKSLGGTIRVSRG